MTPHMMSLKKSLKNGGAGNSTTFYVDKVSHKSIPAGLPSGFQSNVTARNQFSKVQTRPTEMSSIDDHRNIPRGSSGSSSSPYRAAALDGEHAMNSMNEQQNQ